MPFKNRGFFRDEKAATVVFGTLLIILVTITVVSALAFFASVSAKNNMDRQSALEEQKNENLKIVTIQPRESIYYPSCWESLNFTVLNLDILDSRISAVRINENFMMNYFFVDEYGNLLTVGTTDYPMPFNSTHKAEIPAGKAYKIYIGGVHTSEPTQISYPGSLTPVTLNNFPSTAYSSYEYQVFVNVSNSTYNLIGHGAGLPGDDFYVNETTSTLNIINSDISAGNYIVEYTTFLEGNLGFNELQTTDNIAVEIITDRTNIFSKRFMPPEPIAEVQSLGGGQILLDASKSNAPDGFIINYKWDIFNGTTGLPENLTGIKVTSYNTSNVSINLTVKNNYGMISSLSDPGRAGKIFIPL